MTFVVIAQIRAAGCLAAGGDRVRAISSKQRVKPNSATPMMPGSSIGIVTSSQLCQFVAPRSVAASWSERLKRPAPRT